MADNAESVSAVWARIDAWLSKHAPSVKEQLKPALSPSDLDKYEAQVGGPAPAQLKELWAISRGTDGKDVPRLIRGYPLASPATPAVDEDISNMVEGIQEMADDDEEWLDQCPATEQEVRSKKWFPIAGFGIHNFHMVSGETGRVFAVDDGDLELLAESVLDYLKTFADELESGHYRLAKEGRGLEWRAP